MTAVRTLLEGFDAVRQPCTLPMLLSAFVFVVAAGRRAPLAALAHVGGATFLAWLRFAHVWTPDVTGLGALAAGAVMAAATIVVGWTRKPRALAVAGGSALGGVVAAAIWQPCVGERLAVIINDGPTHRLGIVAPTAAYVIGLSALALAVAAVPLAMPRLALPFDHRAITTTGITLGIGIGVLTAVGIWGEVVDELVRRSST